jgi:Fe-S-cluster containining protein
MPFRDSIDKIVTTYFACTTSEPFIYKGKEYVPKPLKVSPLLLRGFTCPVGCGGCCPRFSLDYLPSESKPEKTEKRFVRIHICGVAYSIEIHSDLQDDHENHHCRNLIKDDGRCGIYTVRPFSCDFELIRFFQSEDSSRISQQLFGRGWAFLRVDNQSRGALCTMTPPDANSIKETLRKLYRLKYWAEHFRLKTKVEKIIEWINIGDNTKHLVL